MSPRNLHEFGDSVEPIPAVQNLIHRTARRAGPTDVPAHEGQDVHGSPLLQRAGEAEGAPTDADPRGQFLPERRQVDQRGLNLCEVIRTLLAGGRLVQVAEAVVPLSGRCVAHGCLQALLLACHDLLGGAQIDLEGVPFPAVQTHRRSDGIAEDDA